MALESLLARKKKCDVTDVTTVQPSNGKALDCNGNKSADVTAVTNQTQTAESVTAVTVESRLALQPKAASGKDCTSERV